MLKDLFFLDPQITYLNHGSFGACPKPVFENYQSWQRKLEIEPVQFLGVELDNYLLQARKVLGDYLNAPASDLVFVPNATHGVNIISRSLKLNQGDEILATDQEYGACNFAWEFICKKVGAMFKQQPILFPVNSPDDILEQYWQGVTSRTKVLYISHITSPTALSLPIKQICQRARHEGILTIIDGAHAPGQLEYDLQDIKPDFYTGNCHKWMMSPKGAGFLYADPQVQGILEPLVVSWGYQPVNNTPRESRFVNFFQWTGTLDPSAALAVPAAIEFMEANNWNTVRDNCHQLLSDAIRQLLEITKIRPLYPPDSHLYQQMATVQIPRVNDINLLKSRLFTEYKIEIPCIEWNNQHFIRISIQGYNTADDVARLVSALEILIPDLRS